MNIILTTRCNDYFRSITRVVRLFYNVYHRKGPGINNKSVWKNRVKVSANMKKSLLLNWSDQNERCTPTSLQLRLIRCILADFLTLLYDKESKINHKTNFKNFQIFCVGEFRKQHENVENAITHSK